MEGEDIFESSKSRGYFRRNDRGRKFTWGYRSTRKERMDLPIETRSCDLEIARRDRSPRWPLDEEARERASGFTSKQRSRRSRCWCVHHYRSYIAIAMIFGQ